jgi:hypothetical protein
MRYNIKTMGEDIEVLKERVERLRKLHLRALGAFHALEEMLKFTAPNMVGQERARKNAEAIGVHKGYLNVVRKALNTELHMSLAKIYGDHKDALHIVKLVNYTVANKKALTARNQAPDSSNEAEETCRSLRRSHSERAARDNC